VVQLSQEKIDRIQESMCTEGYDVLFCRLSVNVLFLTGYWPGNHAVAAIVPARGKPTLLVAETEYDNVIEEADRTMLDLETYCFESLFELRGIIDSMTTVLPSILKKMGSVDGVIGIERSFEDGSIARMIGDFKYPSQPTWNALQAALPKANLKDATGLISKLRMIKAQNEIIAIKKAVEIACMGFDAARQAIKPGMTEAELSAVLESAILTQGTGRNGAKYSRGFSSIYSGPKSAKQWAHWTHSTGRVIRDNEIVIMELGSVTDGYWCDLTRNACAGKPSQKAEEILKIVQEAQKRGTSVAKPGIAIGEIDKACHDYLQQNGFGPEYYHHSCGHGVGFNYHEGPAVHQACNIVLEDGMVLCIEPGVYLPGQFGIRTEDMVLITKDGVEVISDYPHTF
jgi:Xaa-Pro aminopeptidase